MEIDWFGVVVNLKALKDTLLVSYHAYNKVWCGLVTGIEESQTTLVGIEVLRCAISIEYIGTLPIWL
jgi:hypothetical protein